MSFWVEQGLPNPRNLMEMGWRFWASFETMKDAMKETKRHPIARILEVKLIGEYKYGKKVEL